MEPTVFFRIIAGDDYSRDGDYSREAIISNITHWKSRPKFLFFFSLPLNKKLMTSNKLNMGFFSVPNLVP